LSEVEKSMISVHSPIMTVIRLKSQQGRWWYRGFKEVEVVLWGNWNQMSWVPTIFLRRTRTTPTRTKEPYWIIMYDILIAEDVLHWSGIHHFMREFTWETRILIVLKLDEISSPKTSTPPNTKKIKTAW
jgi:hypothetical protein